MNIIKLKDILMPDFYPVATLFNTKLKGKYAYWVKMRYIFPLDSIDYDTYIKYEQMDNAAFAESSIEPHIDLYATYYSQCMIEFVKDYIDATETDDINSVYQYEVANAYTADYDIDVDDLKSFRSWLANELLKFNVDGNGNQTGEYSPETLHMLEYYKNNMYNDTVKYLNMFANPNIVSLINNKSTCGCCASTSINIIPAIDTCNPIDVYKNNIREFMINTFSDVTFWTSKNKSFLMLFKKYIDNILRIGFTLPKASETSFNVDCQCASNNNNVLKKILENLSVALQYIIDETVAGHKNFIYDALYDWSKNAYEYMNWK